jgi:hypothetical protein
MGPTHCIYILVHAWATLGIQQRITNAIAYAINPLSVVLASIPNSFSAQERRTWVEPARYILSIAMVSQNPERGLHAQDSCFGQ